MRYRKKPVEIEAVQLLWSTWGEMCEFAPIGQGHCRGGYIGRDGKFTDDFEVDAPMALLIPTLEGDMVATEGDYIIKGVAGEFYPCKSEIFEATYEKVD